MRCTACGHGNRETAAFCEACGTKLTLICAGCAAELQPGARFCDACGHLVGESVQSTAAPDPRTYTPSHLTQKILAARAGLPGERKQVTVLFADVVGSTELVRDRDPEDAQWLLDGAVQLMMDAVHRYEGTVSRLMGDGLMALFGAPVAHEDHAVRACYAALALQDGMRRYAEEVRRAHGVGMEARVGLNSGEVVVRLISDDLHMDYTALGRTVHLASRMEQLAVPGSILITPQTLRLVEGYVQITPLAPTPVKGLDGPIEVFELLGAGPVHTRMQVSASRGLSRFVGREGELATLRERLEQSQVGGGQIVGIVAEPGMGKSRLLYEFARSLAGSQVTYLEGRCLSYGSAVPYLPLLDILRTTCAIGETDDQTFIA